MRIEYHRTLIADAARNAAFFAALKAVIVPGETTVADIGAGTGLLGLMAAKLGAKEVYLYESEAVGSVAEAVLQANRVKGCTLFPCSSLDMDDPPRADVVVSETLGNHALEENIIETLADAARRHLKAGGVLIPSRIRQFVTPVTSPRLHEELTVWDRVGAGLGGDLEPGLVLDLGVAREMSLNNAYVRTLRPDELLEPAGQVFDVVELGAVNTKGRRKGDAVFACEAPVTVYGLAYWWEADLGPGQVLSTAPGAGVSHWEQLYFPQTAPLDIAAGECVRATIASRSSFEEGTHLAWETARLADDGRVLERRKMDLDRGYLP